ncbi:MAG: beta-galactosidase, partial [Microbacterium sp.]|nr:beta-galactosidase [Microbacterium sp.]
VEDQGRVNYGSRLGEAKGLIGSARLGATELTGWAATPVDVDALASAAASSFLAGPEASDVAASVSAGETGAASLAGPIVLVGEFDAVGGVDLFLDTAVWGKGFAFVNGFPLGRYWQVGPQRTLYVPGPVVRDGRNVVVVIEWEQVVAAEARFVAEPGLGPLEE